MELGRDQQDLRSAPGTASISSSSARQSQVLESNGVHVRELRIVLVATVPVCIIVLILSRWQVTFCTPPSCIYLVRSSYVSFTFYLGTNIHVHGVVNRSHLRLEIRSGIR